MSAVVTMVVSKADKKRQSHSPVIMTCNRRELMFGTIGTVEGVMSPVTRLLSSSTMMLSRSRHLSVLRLTINYQPRSGRNHMCEG